MSPQVLKVTYFRLPGSSLCVLKNRDNDKNGRVISSLCPIKNGADYELPIVETQLIDANGDTYKAIAQNWYASWAYLVRFYMYDMPANNIDCNVLNNLYVSAVKMCMEHTVEFPIEEDLDELELIKTNIGKGKIDEYSVNMNTRTAKVKLTYSPQ